LTIVHYAHHLQQVLFLLHILVLSASTSTDIVAAAAATAAAFANAIKQHFIVALAPLHMGADLRTPSLRLGNNCLASCVQINY